MEITKSNFSDKNTKHFQFLLEIIKWNRVLQSNAPALKAVIFEGIKFCDFRYC